MRDSQRSKVYAWERSLPGLQKDRGTMSLEEAEEFAKRVWRSERGRYGRARQGAPIVQAGRGGGHARPTSKLAPNVAAVIPTKNLGNGGRISLGIWARQPVVVLHELAHCLADRGEKHGPRFVGIAIGLYCRHLGMDRDELLGIAAVKGVKVNLTAIGAVPNFGWHRKILRALDTVFPDGATEMDLAIWLRTSYRVIRGAMLTLRRRGEARIVRGKIERVRIPTEAEVELGRGFRSIVEKSTGA